jgi:hypothetical protein
MWATYVVCKKTARVSTHPMGEKSHNLVTLATRKNKYLGIQKLVVKIVAFVTDPKFTHLPTFASDC